VIPTSSSKGLTIVIWILQVLTGCLFLFAGASKLFGAADMVNFFAQVGFRAMASLLLRSLGGWQRRRPFLSAESFLWSRGALRVAGGTRRYALDRAPPSRCISGVPACGDSADRLPSPTHSPRMMPLNRTWVQI
jgi:hypothetical protein